MTCTLHGIKYGFGRNIMTFTRLYIQECTNHAVIIVVSLCHNK